MKQDNEIIFTTEDTETTENGGIPSQQSSVLCDLCVLSGNFQCGDFQW